MKRAFSVLLVLVTLLGLCACDKENAQSTVPGTTTGQVAAGGTEATQSTTKETTAATAESTAPADASTEEPTEEAATVDTTPADEQISHPIENSTGYAISLSGGELTCYTISTEALLYATYEKGKPSDGYYEFREYKGTTYYTPAPSWGWIGAGDLTISGKTVQLETEYGTMKLELISANKYKVTKGVGVFTTGMEFSFGGKSCSHFGHLYSVRCEDDVTCNSCGQYKCPGFGHEYGEDGVCFRCFSAMRPSEEPDDPGQETEPSEGSGDGSGEDSGDGSGEDSGEGAGE